MDCILVRSKNINVQHLDFKKYSTFEHESVKYRISKIEPNALNLEVTEKLLFLKQLITLAKMQYLQKIN